MASRKTCDKCEHYALSDEERYPHAGVAYPNDGECALMIDSNDADVREPDRCYAWDYEGYRAGVYVGPKFGCIHWTKKVLTKE